MDRLSRAIQEFRTRPPASITANDLENLLNEINSLLDSLPVTPPEQNRIPEGYYNRASDIRNNVSARLRQLRQSAGKRRKRRDITKRRK